MEDGPTLMAPYAGQAQQQQIAVPHTIVLKSYQYSPEESCWAMIPYAQLYPPGSQTEAQGLAPPPVKQIDIFTAQQTYPL